MSKVPEWYVITGGPNSGKTTIIKRLRMLGYKTVPEYARLFINRKMKNGEEIGDIRGNARAFQNKIMKLKISMDTRVPKNKIVFFDRGIPDLLAYYRFLKIRPPKIAERLGKNRYKKIFLLHMVPYKTDYARNETKSDALTIHHLINQAYKRMGYKIVKVPLMPVQKRVEFILSHAFS